MLQFLSYVLVYYLLFHTNQHSSFMNSITMLFNIFSMWPYAILTAHHLNSYLNQNDSFLCGFHAKISGVRFGAAYLTLGVGNGAQTPSII